MKRLTGVSTLWICGLLAVGLLVASDVRRAPDWAYGYLKPLEASDPVAPACPATAKPFPDCAYPAAVSYTHLTLPTIYSV